MLTNSWDVLRECAAAVLLAFPAPLPSCETGAHLSTFGGVCRVRSVGHMNLWLTNFAICAESSMLKRLD